MAGKVTVLSAASPTPTSTPSASPTPTPLAPVGPVGANVSRRLMAVLSGANEVPTDTSPATGYALFEVSADLTQLTYYLSSTVTSTTQAHIHRGPVGVNGPIVFTLAATPGFTVATGVLTISPDVASELFTRDL